MLKESQLRDFYGCITEPVQVVAMIMSATDCAIIQPDGRSFRVYQSTTRVTAADLGRFAQNLQVKSIDGNMIYAPLVYDKIKPERGVIEEYRYGWLVVWGFNDDDNTLANRKRTLGLLAILVARILYQSDQPLTDKSVVYPTFPSRN